MEELMNLHSSRGVRSLDSSRLLSNAQRIAIDSDTDNQAVRSRCVEIKMRAFKRYAVVEEVVEKLRKYILARYSAELGRSAKTLADRRALVEVVIDDVVKIMKDLNNVMKMSDMVIEDCTAAGFTLKRIGDLLALKSHER